MQAAEEVIKLPNGFSRQQVASCITHRRLELTILPTEKCNFRCTYCYEDFLVGRMPETVQRGVEALLRRRAPELEQLALGWFGGEPLLAKSVIYRIAETAAQLSKLHGCSITGGLTTNAYNLDVECLERLVSLHHDFYQISLDGWEEGHDRTRRRADGAGTFKRIWANLLAARETGLRFEFQLRIHVTHENFASLMILCRELGRAFGGDGRFYLNFQDVRNMGGKNGDAVVSVAPRAFKEAVRDLQREFARGARERSGDQIDEAEEARVAETLRLSTVATESTGGESSSGRRAYQLEESEPYICYAAKPNFFLIRADGRVGKCTVALDDPRNQLGTLTEDGRLMIEDERHRPWFKGFEELDADYLGCPIQKIPRLTPEKQLRREIPASVVA